jgi:hypothetical protein
MHLGVQAQVSKWSFGATSALTLDYRTLYTDGTTTSNAIKRIRENNEVKKLSYRVGLLAQRALSNNLAIESGIMFSDRGYQMDFEGGIFEDQIDSTNGFTKVTAESTGDFDPKVHFRYLEIPITILKTFEINKLQYSVGVGSSIDYLIQASDNNNFKNLNVSPHIQTGFNFKINEHQTISSNLFYRIGALNIIDTPVTAKLWSTGLKFAYYYTL